MLGAIITIIFCLVSTTMIVTFLWLEYDYYKVKVSAVSSVPWMRHAVKKVLKSDIIDKNISPKVVYELGSGWGPLVVDAAKTFPNATVKGIEFSYLAAKFSKIRAKLNSLKKVEIHRKDFFKQDLSDADVIILYMLESILADLSPKFIAELKPGTVIVSNTFIIKGWTPVATHKIVKKPIPLNIYVYTVPESLPKKEA